MTKFSQLSYAFLGVLISGCAAQHANVPTATNFPTTQQAVLQAAQHWDIINNRVADQLVSSLNKKINKNEKIFIKSQNSIYCKQLNLDIIKRLTEEGFHVIRHDAMIVSPPPLNAVLVDLKVNTVPFSSGRKQAKNIGIPSAITTGLWALDALSATATGALSAGIYSYDVYEWFKSNVATTNTPRTEIIIDVVSSKSDEYLAVDKGFYYVLDSDDKLYQAASDVYLKEFNITGSKK